MLDPSEPDYDPIQKSWRESQSFNIAWTKDGERLTWPQRIGFAIFSFFLFTAGLLGETLALNTIWTDGSISIGVIIAMFTGLVFLIPGTLGLRNTLRFPKSSP